jgi:hypothetical protein
VEARGPRGAGGRGVSTAKSCIKSFYIKIQAEESNAENIQNKKN